MNLGGTGRRYSFSFYQVPNAYAKQHCALKSAQRDLAYILKLGHSQLMRGEDKEKRERKKRKNSLSPEVLFSLSSSFPSLFKNNVKMFFNTLITN